MTRKRALIAGSSGLVGGYCLEELLNSDVYETVTALVRRPLGREHAKLHQVQVDFDELEDLGDLLRARDVFCCLGTTMRKAGSREAFRKVDFEYPLALARICHRHGARQFVLISALGADPSARIAFYNRVKGEVEEAIGEIGYGTLVIMRPSLLLGNRAEARLGETLGKVASLFASPFLLGKLRKYRAVEARDVARAMVRLANFGLQGRHVVESDQIQEEARR